MDAKEYLNRACHVDQRIQSKMEQAERLRGLAEKITVNFSDLPRNPGQSQQRMEDAVCKLLDLESEIVSEVAALVDIKRETMTVIKTVPCGEQQTLLELRYLCGMPWRRIGFRMGYGKSNVFRIHDAALKKIKIS